MTTEQGVVHTSTLMEVHRITLPSGATGDGVAVARLHAEAYARARGFEIRAGSFDVVKTRDTEGVEFTLTVGKGDVALDQRVPGSLDTWTWSAPAVEWWRRIFNRADGRQGRVLARREDGLASVTPLRPGTPATEVPEGAPLHGAGDMPPWLKRIFEDDDLV